MKKALLVVDVQNDFLPGGSLAVSEGDRVIPPINECLAMPFDLIVATKDWHPPNHVSFAKRHGKQAGEVVSWHRGQQQLWPEHCVQNSPGADFPETLQIDRVPHKTIYKGENSEIDSYGGFFDNQRARSTGLHSLLQEHGIEEVYIVGLTTDYCVCFTALDAQELGYRTHVVMDACGGIDQHPGDVQKAYEKMRSRGIHLTTMSELRDRSPLKGKS